MKRFPFTAQGIAALQSELYSLTDPELARQAQSSAEDFLSWAASRFDLDVRLLGDIRNMPYPVRQQLGWCVACCIIARQPLSILDLRTGPALSGLHGQSLSAEFNFSITTAASSGALTLSLVNDAEKNP